MAMDIIDQNDLAETLMERKSLCVSIYLPTHRTGQTEQNAIRFKNLVSKVEDQLRRSGLRIQNISILIQPARRLLERTGYWQYLSDGLAAFISSDHHRFYRLPYPFPELAIVSDYYHIKPLLPLITVNGRYYVLLICKKGVKLFQGTRFGVSEIDLKSLPVGFVELARSREFKKQLQFHIGAPASQGKRGGRFFGTGDKDRNVKDDLLRYFQKVDKVLRPLLKTEKVPLLLSGVDYLTSLFRSVCGYDHLMTDSVSGSLDQISSDQLHDRTWPLVEPFFRESQSNAVQQYGLLAETGSDKIVTKIEDIIKYSLEGRIRTLIVPVGIQVWGQINVKENGIDLHASQQPGDRDLLNYVAIKAKLTGASVFAVRPDEMPGELSAAAILRY